MWTVYLGDELIDLMTDHEVCDLMDLAEMPGTDIDVIVDLLRGVVSIE